MTLSGYEYVCMYDSAHQGLAQLMLSINDFKLPYTRNHFNGLESEISAYIMEHLIAR